MNLIESEMFLFNATKALLEVKHSLAQEGWLAAISFLEEEHQPMLESLVERLEPIAGEYKTTYEEPPPPATMHAKEVSRKLKSAKVSEIVCYSFTSDIPSFVLNATGFAIAIAGLTAAPLTGGISAAVSALGVALLIPANLVREKDEYRLKIYGSVLRAGYEKLLTLISSRKEEPWLGVLADDVCIETGMVREKVMGLLQDLMKSGWIENHSGSEVLKMRPKLELLYGKPDLQEPCLSVFEVVRRIFRVYLHNRSSRHWKWKPNEDDVHQIVGGDKETLRQGLEALYQKRILKSYSRKGYFYIWIPL
jgi:hypothetical protein